MVIGGGSIHMAISPKNRWIFRMEVTTSRMTACTRPVRNIVMMMRKDEHQKMLLTDQYLGRWV